MITKRELLTIQDHAPLLTVIEQQLVSSHIEAIDHIHNLEKTLDGLAKSISSILAGDMASATAWAYATPNVEKFLSI
ncbi:hypothetical protein SEA_SLIMJIMMY_133 [Mycobacterium phage SlimJimmy]|nr:hypothetical protein SEA_SLIMJIMMY_133 [Mycobacterium phage SlimJimmy]